MHDPSGPAGSSLSPPGSPTAGSAVDVAALLDEAPLGKRQREVILLCFLVSMLDGFNTQAIAFAAPDLAVRWQLPLSAFGPIFSAGLLGSMIGVALGGRLADRYGRRRLTLASVSLFGVATLASAAIHSVDSLIALRIVAGLGLGGAIPNFMALVAEFAPRRTRATAVAITLWGFPLGAVAGGTISAGIIARGGAAAVFGLGGVTALALVPVLIFRLPESLRWSLTRGEKARATARAVLHQIMPDLAIEPDTALLVREQPAPVHPYRVLLVGEFAQRTLLFSVAMFMSLLLSYLLVSWIPLLLRQDGFGPGVAIAGTVIFNLAGVVGSLFFTRAMDGGTRPLPLMVCIFCAAAVAVALIGLGSHAGPVLSTIFVAGALLLGIQMTLSAFIVGHYPTSLRATALGLVQAVGRVGSLLGPLCASSLISAGLPLQWIFAICSIPALLAATSLALLALLSSRITPSQVRAANRT